MARPRFVTFGRHATLAVAAMILVGLAIDFGNEVRGDGAFPNSEAVLLPADRPQQIILATTFGLVVSDDDGDHWQYSCESHATANGRLYNLGPAPDDRILTVSDLGVAMSADLGCSWMVGGGLLAGALVSDAFPDPSDALHVLAVAKPLAGNLATPAQLFSSFDGGLSYDAVPYAGPSVGGISGVEIARSDPLTVYVTAFETTPDARVHPRLVRSSDGGATFETIDLEPLLGPGSVSIAAVDPNDARRIFLRVTGVNAQMRTVEQIAVSFDGGLTFAIPVSLTGGTLTAFLARHNGTVLVSGRLGATVVGYRSQDGGRTFASWQSGIHPRGFGERGTTLFVAADNATDGFALGSSEDDGDTWTPRLRFADIQAIRGCVEQECRDDCLRQSEVGLFPPSVCGDGPGQGDVAVKRAGGGCSLMVDTTWDGGSVDQLGLWVAVCFIAWTMSRRRPRGRMDGRRPCSK